MTTIEIELDEPRSIMYDAIEEEFGHVFTDAQVEDAVNERLTTLWDNRDQIRERVEQD